MFMSYIYILESLRDGRFYVGSTTDLDRRVAHHKGGHTYSTKRFGALKLVFSQKFDSLKEVRYLESKLKKMKRKDYLKKIIEDGFIRMKIPR